MGPTRKERIMTQAAAAREIFDWLPDKALFSILYGKKDRSSIVVPTTLEELCTEVSSHFVGWPEYHVRHFSKYDCCRQFYKFNHTLCYCVKELSNGTVSLSAHRPYENGHCCGRKPQTEDQT